MQLYQEHRVNPFASCMPLLLQLPVFFCLYYAIRGTPELREAHFLWLTLGKPDPYFILLVLYVVSQLASTELSLTYTTDNRQKWMMRAMPLFFVVVLLRFPSGLFVYWVTTNLWTVGQLLIIRRRLKSLPEAEPAKPRKQSRFMQAMTQAQEQRAAQTSRQARAARAAGPGRVASRRRGHAAQRPAVRPARGAAEGRPDGRPGSRPEGRRGSRPDGRPGSRPEAGPSGRPSGRPGSARRAP